MNIFNASETECIRDQNDAFRCFPQIANAYGIKGKFVVTRGIAEIKTKREDAILTRVQAFDDFTEDNDPHGEHDFGSFEYLGHKIFWKIDYYDPDYLMGSENPADIEKTRRVLTIMLAEEY